MSPGLHTLGANRSKREQPHHLWWDMLFLTSYENNKKTNSTCEAKSGNKV